MPFRRHLAILCAATLAAGSSALFGEGETPGASAVAGRTTVPATLAPGAALPDGAVRFGRVDVIDSNGFEKPLVAQSMLVPVGWRTSGGVVWLAQTPDCGVSNPHTNFLASSPDGRHGFAILPIARYSGWTVLGRTSGGGCPNLVSPEPRQVVESYVQQFWPGARILDVRARPQLQQQLQALHGGLPGIDGTRVRVEASQTLFAYEHEGLPQRGTLVVGVVVRDMSLGPDPMSGQPIMSSSTLIQPFAAAFAPDGELDFDGVEALAATIRFDPAYARRMNEHYRRMAAAARGSRPSAPSGPSPGDIYASILDDGHQSFMNRSAGSDVGQREQVESIHGVETYDDPYHGGTVQLDSSYRHAWQLDDGTYVLTDDHFFVPENAGLSGRRLEATR